MSDKTFKIVGDDISDGYHTFGELYEHRCLLWIAYILSDGCPGYKTYWVRDHFDGWDLLGVIVNRIGQLSYHVSSKYRHLYERFIVEVTKENAEEMYDGHTAADVLKRLQEIIE